MFTKDGRVVVETLRQGEPWLFTGLLDHEFTRMMAGNGAALAWETTELLGVDGRPVRIICRRFTECVRTRGRNRSWMQLPRRIAAAMRNNTVPDGATRNRNPDAIQLVLLFPLSLCRAR